MSWDAREGEPAFDATGHRARLVVGEVDAELLLEHLVHRAHAIVGDLRLRRGATLGLRSARRPAACSARTRGMSCGARTQWATPESARGPRHPVELRAVDVLDDDQTAGLVNVENASRPIAAAARHHDGDRARPAVLRERAKEHVDGQRALLLPILLAQQEPPAGDDHLVLRRIEIDVIGFDRHSVLDEVDRKFGVTSEQLVHHAFEIGRQVLDDHERHPGVLRDVVEEALDGLEPTRRCSDADDVGRRSQRAVILSRGPCLSFHPIHVSVSIRLIRRNVQKAAWRLPARANSGACLTGEARRTFGRRPIGGQGEGV